MNQDEAKGKVAAAAAIFLILTVVALYLFPWLLPLFYWLSPAPLARARAIVIQSAMPTFAIIVWGAVAKCATRTSVISV